MASLGGLSPSPFLWVSKVTLGTPAARLPRRFRHSRCWCLGRLRRVRWLVFGPGEASLGGSVATLGELSPSPFLWVSKVRGF